jgi:hypothetical protein
MKSLLGGSREESVGLWMVDDEKCLDRRLNSQRGSALFEGVGARWDGDLDQQQVSLPELAPLSRSFPAGLSAVFSRTSKLLRTFIGRPFFRKSGRKSDAFLSIWKTR